MPLATIFSVTKAVQLIGSLQPDVATSLCIVSNTKQDLSYFCMGVCCPLVDRYTTANAERHMHLHKVRVSYEAKA